MSKSGKQTGKPAAERRPPSRCMANTVFWGWILILIPLWVTPIVLLTKYTPDTSGRFGADYGSVGVSLFMLILYAVLVYFGVKVLFATAMRSANVAEVATRLQDKGKGDIASMIEKAKDVEHRAQYVYPFIFSMATTLPALGIAVASHDGRNRWDETVGGAMIGLAAIFTLLYTMLLAGSDLAFIDKLVNHAMGWDAKHGDKETMQNLTAGKGYYIPVHTMSDDPARFTEPYDY